MEVFCPTSKVMTYCQRLWKLIDGGSVDILSKVLILKGGVDFRALVAGWFLKKSFTCWGQILMKTSHFHTLSSFFHQWLCILLPGTELSQRCFNFVVLIGDELTSWSNTKHNWRRNNFAIHSFDLKNIFNIERQCLNSFILKLMKRVEPDLMKRSV